MWRGSNGAAQIHIIQLNITFRWIFAGKRKRQRNVAAKKTGCIWIVPKKATIFSREMIAKMGRK